MKKNFLDMSRLENSCDEGTAQLIRSSFPSAAGNMGDLLRRLGYEFQNPGLFLESMTHSSAARYLEKIGGLSTPLPYNERLEFLGDAVLGLALGSALMLQSGKFGEGQLSKIRASLVQEATLAGISRRVGIGKCILLAPGEERAMGREKDSVLADALEALFGAVYLDKGFEAASSLILSLYEPFLSSELMELTQKDYKSRLQEMTQAQLKETPEYRVVRSDGPDHSLSFQVEVLIRGVLLGRGAGSSKKAASQEAARAGIERWGELKGSWGPKD